MTREEVIKNIKEHCYFANLVSPAKEALDMAIKVLEQTELNLCEDYIKHKIDCLEDLASIETNEGRWREEGQYLYAISVLEEIEEYIKSLPSVTSQPKTEQERWICPSCKTTMVKYPIIEKEQKTEWITKWIPVSERFPELGKRVLCQCQANIYEVLKLTVDGWYYNPDHCYMESFVIAWQPLPEPYKEG